LKPQIPQISQIRLHRNPRATPENSAAFVRLRLSEFLLFDPDFGK